MISLYPKNWKLAISDFLLYKGAGLTAPVAGAIKLMPGTSSNQAFRRIDVENETGNVEGLSKLHYVAKLKERCPWQQRSSMASR